MSYNIVRNVSDFEYIEELTTRYPELTVSRIVIKKESDICVNQNSNIPQESSGNIDSEVQNDIYEIISDTDEDTEQLEAQQIAPVVNLDAICFIARRKSMFPTYYKKEIFNHLKSILKDKRVNDVLNLGIKTNGYPLRVQDLMSLLTPDAWLKDSVIQNYLALVVSNCDKTETMTTDFLISYKKRGFDSAFRCFYKYDLNNLNKVAFPINPGKAHWALFVVEIWEGKIYHFESYKEISFTQELKLIIQFLSQAVQRYIKLSGVERTAPEKWKCIDGRSPKQENNDDCGVFTCMNARYFLSNKKPSRKFIQKYVPILRQIIAFELLNNELERF